MAIRWIRTSTEQTAEPQLYVFTILVAEEKGGGKTLWDSISKQLIRRLWLAGETPIGYYGIMEGWFCSNLWHCGHVTHINQGFTLPLITSWENDQTLVSPLMRRPTISRAGLNNSINSTRKDWLSFCDSLKAHNPRHYRLQSFPFRLIGWGRQFIPIGKSGT